MGRGFEIFSIFEKIKQPRKKKKPSGNYSEVYTKYLEMKLDHDSGEMVGQVLKGPFSGQRFSRLSVNDIIQLRKECQKEDLQSVPLLDAFLDHIQPKWRDHPDVQPETNDAEPKRKDINIEEAYAILGINKGASEEEIRTAHKNLMKKLHPDQGGSTYLAAKINQAKDLLLSYK
ncbi:MAG: DnaJ domain-containing protein [Methyloligellaceae bacterium]